MKNLIKIFTIILMLSIVAVCATGCDKSDNKTDNSVNSMKATESKTYANIEEYYNNPSFQSEIETEAESVSDTMMLFCYVDNNKLLYEYQYLNQLADDEINSAKNTFDTNLEDSADSIKTLMQELVDYVNEVNPIVVYKYLNADGTVIAEKEFDKSILEG